MSKVSIKRLKHFEVVLGGHPDKVCDIIANRMSQEILKRNPLARTAIEVVWYGNVINVFGEVSGNTMSLVQMEQLVMSVMEELNYGKGFEISINFAKQSYEIRNAVGNYGAGDNGIFITGYHRVWSPITEELKEIAKILTNKAGEFRYETDGKFIAEFNVDTAEMEKFTLNIASSEWLTNLNRKDFAAYLHNLLKHFFDLSDKVTIEINPKGDWHLCGGFADSGLTGRKLACDNTLGLFRQGGGAFFGKDYSKADHSVPIYLYNLAKELIQKEQYKEKESIELHAHTIIGDTEVQIFDDSSSLIEVTDFETVKEYARNNPMGWEGLNSAVL